MSRAWLIVVVIAVAVSARAGALRFASVSNEPYPPVVDGNGRTTTVYAADMMLDGDPKTFACLWDDSRGGTRNETKPPRGDTPVTGAMVLDLGGEYETDGIELVSRADGGRFLPKEIEMFGIKY